MINLIPKEEKKKIQKGFYYRLAIVYLLALSLPIVIGIIVIIPSYFVTHTKESLVDKKLESQKNEPMPLLAEETMAVISDLDKKLKVVESAEHDKFIVSQKVINAIVLKKMPSIKITQISYKNSLKNEVVPDRKITIEGTAPSRDVLLLFRQALEDDVNFTEVDLPISNFVKGSNIHFYLSLVPRVTENSAAQAL